MLDCLLVHEFGNMIVAGTKQECEFGLRVLTTYGERADKFSIISLGDYENIYSIGLARALAQYELKTGKTVIKPFGY